LDFGALQISAANASLAASRDVNSLHCQRAARMSRSRPGRAEQPDDLRYPRQLREVPACRQHPRPDVIDAMLRIRTVGGDGVGQSLVTQNLAGGIDQRRLGVGFADASFRLGPAGVRTA